MDKQELIERIIPIVDAEESQDSDYNTGVFYEFTVANRTVRSRLTPDQIDAIATAWIEDRENAQDEAHYKGAHLALEKVAAHDPRLGEPSDELTTYVMTRIDADGFWWIANEVRRDLTKTKEDTQADVDRAVTEAKYSVIPDLAWCLGKLRGLGHPNDAMEKRYTPYMTIEAQLPPHNPTQLENDSQEQN